MPEAIQVVVETGSVLVALLPPQDAGGVDDTAVQNRAGHERCKETNISHFSLLVAPLFTQTRPTMQMSIKNIWYQNWFFQN